MPENISVILSEPRPDDPGVEALADSLAERLAGRPGLRLAHVANLYDLEPAGPVMESIRRIEGDLVVLGVSTPGRHSGRSRRPASPAAWRIAASPPSGRSGACVFTRAPTPARFSARSTGSSPAHTGGRPHLGLAASPCGHPPRHQRWYPVIDRQRCSGCLECLNFCLFGVYGVDAAGGLLIEQPDACRAGCPACSRICPEGAIMFPQHVDPAIAGDDKASLEGLKLDLSQLFAGADPSVMATAERDRALAAVETREDSRGGDQLDDLVDEMDEMDL